MYVSLVLSARLWKFERKICRHKISIMFNEICINEEMLPKYTYIYIYIYIYMTKQNYNILHAVRIISIFFLNVPRCNMETILRHHFSFIFFYFFRLFLNSSTKEKCLNNRTHTHTEKCYLIYIYQTLSLPPSLSLYIYIYIYNYSFSKF